MMTMTMTTTQKIDNSIFRPMGGFSLVELMVAMVISLMLMAGVIQIFTGTKLTFLAQEGHSRIQENARFALGRLTEDIGAAGYLGCLDSDAPVQPFTNDLTNKALGSAHDYSTAIFGTNDAGVNSSDTITIRRAGSGSSIRLTQPMALSTSDLELDTTSTFYSSLQQFDLLVVGDCATASVFMITNDPTTSTGTIQHVSGVTATSGPNNGQSNVTGDLERVFGSDTSSVAGATRVGTATYQLCASTSGSGTSLYLNSNNCASATQANELVEGVDDMQILYGVDTDATAGIEQYLRADQITTAIQWNNIASVRMTLEFNPVQQELGAAYSQFYTTTVRVRNRGG